MKKLTSLAAAPLLLACTALQAEIIDFVDMTENGTYGESAWSTLSVSRTGFTVDITATKNGAAAFAYLDWNHAGLGVCGNAGNGNGSPDTSRAGQSSNICNPGDDDNVTLAEVLTFEFDVDVTIDKIWFNNTHDPDRTIIAPDLITIGGVDILAVGNGYAPTSNQYNTAANHDSSVDNWLGPFVVNAGAANALTVAYNNEQFYISAMEITVQPPPATAPEPGIVALLGAGLLGMGIASRRRVASRAGTS